MAHGLTYRLLGSRKNGILRQCMHVACVRLLNVPLAVLTVPGLLLLLQSLGAGEKDDRDVMAAIQASKRVGEVADPDVMAAIAEST